MGRMGGMMELRRESFVRFLLIEPMDPALH
jgi:hypothetical protein